MGRVAEVVVVCQWPVIMKGQEWSEVEEALALALLAEEVSFPCLSL